ncbi:MAG: glycosyltransferase family 4 protein [Desulfomonile tiedjei]|uniref:Glycosyltransferase family 4 protein n=1 Tax=Desulfomonile tiedjei TaxID=2358 RepID=A0A9D6Z237_9BACT|nr:glycosyltransferase family 4 protein [Desulfomonile tiedjei]
MPAPPMVADSGGFDGQTAKICDRTQESERLASQLVHFVANRYEEHNLKRILMVGPVPPPYGGIASLMDDIVNSSLSEEYSFEVFERSGVFPRDAQGFLGRNVFRLRRFARFFHKVISGRFSIVHIHSADPAFLGTTIIMLLARLARVKILLHMHGTDWDSFYPEAPWFTKLYTRLGLCLPNTIVVLYSLWRDNIKRLGTSARVIVLRNFIHNSAPPPRDQVELAVKTLDLEPGNFVVVTVGTVGWRKGCFDILKAVRRVVTEEPTVRFVMVGGEEKPGEWQQLTDIIIRDDLARWVRMTGEVDREKIPLYLALADVFLLPSYIEGMPVAIIEAMRSGLPVISTRVNAIPDMIEQEVSGLLINPGASDEIADAVLRLKRDPELRNSIRSGARSCFIEKFEFSRGVENLRTFYRDLLT